MGIEYIERHAADQIGSSSPRGMGLINILLHTRVCAFDYRHLFLFFSPRALTLLRQPLPHGSYDGALRVFDRGQTLFHTAPFHATPITSFDIVPSQQRKHQASSTDDDEDQLLVVTASHDRTAQLSRISFGETQTTSTFLAASRRTHRRRGVWSGRRKKPDSRPGRLNRVVVDNDS